MESTLTLAVREAATSVQPSALARLEDLLRSGATVDPDEEPPIVEAAYRRYADKVLPLLFKYGADPSQRRSDGVSVLEILARRRVATAAVDILLHHGAKPAQAGTYITRISFEKYLIRADEVFFACLDQLIKSATTRLADPSPDFEYDPWSQPEGEELLDRLRGHLVPSPNPPGDVKLLLIGEEELDCIEAAVRFCGESVRREVGISTEVLEQDLRLLTPTDDGRERD